MKKFALALGMAVLAGAAAADYKGEPRDLLSGTGGGSWNGGFGERALLVINVQGTQSWDGFGDLNNIIAQYNLGAGAHITGIGWDVELQTLVSPSWLSEIAVDFSNTGGTAGVSLAPGSGDDFGGNDFYSSGGVVDLIGLGLDFNLDADGVLNVQFFEGFDDFADTAEGLWKGGTLTIQYTIVPAPGAMALLGLGGLVATRRRR